MSDAAQSLCESYDRVEIPEIQPDVTRVCLYGGVCPCCAKRFKAEPPEGLEPGSPFGPNLRAFVVYLRSVQGIPLARLSHVLRDLFGLEISEGALVNILSASRKPFAAQTSLIKARQLVGVLEDEQLVRFDLVGHHAAEIWRVALEQNDAIAASGTGANVGFDLFARPQQQRQVRWR